MTETKNQQLAYAVAGAVPIRLHANENPYALPPAIWQEIEQELATLELNRYPDKAMRLFYQALAEHTGFPPEMLLAGNGLEEIILLLLVALGRARQVILPIPTFFVYNELATALGLSVVEVPLLAESWQLDLPRILQVAGQEEGLIIICRPNNPTGNLFRRQDILRLLTETKLTVVVDEAYYGFCEDTMLPDLANHERLVVLRTFSKTYGLAGIRLGYLVAQAQVVEAVDRVRPVYNVNALTLTIGRIALRRERELLARLPAIIAERERLTTELATIPGVEVYPSAANFLLVKLPAAATPIWQELREAGIHVRQLGVKQPNLLRISVGQQQENEKFLSILRRALAE